MEDSLYWPKAEARGGARPDERDPVEHATRSIKHKRPYHRQAAIFQALDSAREVSEACYGLTVLNVV